MLKLIYKIKKNRLGFVRASLFNKNGAGFTLVELLISISLFTMITFAISAVYLSFTKTQTRTQVSQQLLNDAQYALEVMAREIRNTTIFDYDTSSSNCAGKIEFLNSYFSNVSQCIFLKKDDGTLVTFARMLRTDNSHNGLYYLVLDCDEDYSTCEVLNYRDGLVYTPILSKAVNNIELTDLDIVIEPTDVAINEQSRVTVRLGVQYDGNQDIENVSHVIQTTVSSRLYKP
ncbi:prepilin-type N-terminal cleavage/methylation domain-containing protein [bacterium]|nr:prepilin-type N-terminal cleavage/methylation domain-containing protein [bacterium]